MGFVSFCEFKKQYRLWIFTQELSKIQLYTHYNYDFICGEN